MIIDMYSFHTSLRSNSQIKSAMTVSSFKFIVVFNLMCWIWTSNFSCRFRMIFKKNFMKFQDQYNEDVVIIELVDEVNEFIFNENEN